MFAICTAGQGTDPGLPGLPPQIGRGWGTQAGGTPSSCLRQRGPGQQCRSWAAGERLPPARWCQSDTSRRHKSSPEMGLLGRRDLTTLRPPSRAHLEKSWAQLGKARSKKPFLELAHQVLTCLAPSPAARSHAAPMNAVFLLPAAQPLAAPQPLRLQREKSQGLFFCPFPLARLCTALRAQGGASPLGTALQTPVPTGIQEGPSPPTSKKEQGWPQPHCKEGRRSKQDAPCYLPTCKGEKQSKNINSPASPRGHQLLNGVWKHLSSWKWESQRGLRTDPSLAANNCSLHHALGLLGLDEQKLRPCCGAKQPGQLSTAGNHSSNQMGC